ncbi:ATP-binding protein [Adlercreutzia shanghongiae]|uniref:ATP-binding protein n=1 Tax=Adlercreutzia shanghongiae TaxID=3111773 RepID=A0ABU6J162_9ACTN|nr:ATP-binding protein [Adlercreutzia sp. R22]MEC4295799.1 ATP-binding protein [Adlercreutzia sp. R22]
MEYIKRDIEGEFLSYASEFPLVLLTGMRQCGKSTMLAHLAKDGRATVTLDDLQERALAQDDPQMFLQLHEPPLIIDEVQYAPQLFPYLKLYADSHPDARGSFWLTGSQPFPLMKLAGESLAGRVGILHMLPLSQHELYGSGPLRPLDIAIPELKERLAEQEPAALPQVYERIFRGWMPAVANGRTPNVDHFYRSYMQTYIERDVRELDGAASAVDFSRFMAAAAAQVGQLLNIESMARDVGIPRAKAQEWLGILQKCDIVFLLQPYSNNAMKRAVKTSKLYFNDTGLAAWLGRWSSPETLAAGALSGQIFENYVVSEITKTFANSGDVAQLWFYRDRDAKEIDAVIERDGALYPIEIKRSANPQRKDIAAFSVLARSPLDLGVGMLVCLAERLGALDESCLTFPAWGI